MTNPTRRDFLKLVTTGLLSAAGLLGLGGLIRYLDYDGEPASKTFVDAGEAARYPPGSRTVLRDVPALLISTQAGFVALSLICTHLGCTVEQSESGFHCPCHGSRFDAQGTVERGPARQNLAHLKVEVTAQGHVLIHTN